MDLLLFPVGQKLVFELVRITVKVIKFKQKCRLAYLKIILLNLERVADLGRFRLLRSRMNLNPF